MTKLETELTAAAVEAYKAVRVLENPEQKKATIELPIRTSIILCFENGDVRSTVLMFGKPIGRVVPVILALSLALALTAAWFIPYRSLAITVGSPMILVFLLICQHARVTWVLRNRLRAVAEKALSAQLAN